jgi:RNA polymerase sigma-70 factor, ECF subfamily
VALSEIDRNLLERCLQGKPRAWEDFVDRFMGLVVHVVTHSAQCRGVRLSPEDRDDLMGDVFLTIIGNDFTLLRRFRGESSLATYLTVIARRTVVRQLIRHKSLPLAEQGAVARQPSLESTAEVHQRLGNREEVERLLNGLQESEARVVRMYHLEGKSYQEISAAVGVPENTIGPVLSRARTKMRRAGVNQPAG